MTLDWQWIKRVMMDDNAEQMERWLESGELGPNDSNGLSASLLSSACNWNAQGVLQVLVQHGAEVNPEDGKTPNGLNPSLAKDRYDVFVQLLSYGADIEYRGGNFADGTALSETGFRFARSGDAGVKYIDRLVLAGAHLTTPNARGATPAQQARGGKNDHADARIEDYIAFEAKLADGEITKQDVLDALHLPGIWRQMDAIFDVLTAKSETLTREELLQPVAILGREQAEPPVLWIALAGKLDALNVYLTEENEAEIGYDQLVGADRTATPLMQSLCKEWGAVQLFDSEMVSLMNHHELRALHHALPEIQRQEVGGFHQLLANATRNERSAARGGIA